MKIMHSFVYETAEQYNYNVNNETFNVLQHGFNEQQHKFHTTIEEMTP